METTLTLLRGIVTLDEDTYRAFLKSPDVMKRGFLILLACYFIATIPVFVQSWRDSARRFTPEVAAEVQEQFLSVFEQFTPADAGSDDDMQMFMDNFVQGMNIGVELDALPMPLPRSLASGLQALGRWFTAALAGIGPWLAYGAVVILFAKLAGGRGILNDFYGLTALVAVPSLLRILSFIPFLGAAFSLTALIWGAVVYVRAVQISQDFTPAKAFLIAFLPVIIVAGLSLCFGLVGISSLMAAIASAQ